MRFLLIPLLFATPLLAQDFGAAPMAPAQAKPAEITITNPLVQTLLDTKPRTPREWVQAILTLIDLKHASVGRQFVNQLLGANLTEDQLEALHREFGSPAFLRIGGHPDLLPEAKQFADAVLDAANKLAQDPARLAQWIDKLQDPSPAARSRAAAELARGGQASVLALIAVLADPARENEYARVRDALASMRETAISPLIATVETDNPALKVQAIESLRRMGTVDPAIYSLTPALNPASPPEVKQAAEKGLTQMLGQVPDLRTAASTLYSRARTEYDRSLLIRADVEPRAVWLWDREAAQPAVKAYPPFMASLQAAVRLSKDLRELMPESLPVRRLYFGSLLELAAYEAGLDQPLAVGDGTAHDLAAALGPAAIEDVLAQTMASGHIGAAAAAARILGEIGQGDLLNNRGAAPSVLAQAVIHPDRRLRYAAASAILNLKPQQPFPGSSDVLKAAIYFAGSAGERRGLVLETKLQEATRMASLLMQSGFDDVDAVTQGRDFLERAIVWADYELALIDFNLPRTNIDELVQMLRHDHRSRDIPVLLVTTSVEEQRAARYYADRLPRTGVMVRPIDQAGMEVQVKNFLSKIGSDLPPPELRLEQAKTALGWLGQMARPSPPLYNVHRAARVAEAALAVPDLTMPAALLLADLGTSGSQQAILNLVNRTNVPLELRQSAAQAFRHSVHRNGILLTSAELLQQYDRYNASEREPAETQELLASVLDTLESYRKKE